MRCVSTPRPRCLHRPEPGELRVVTPPGANGHRRRARRPAHGHRDHPRHLRQHARERFGGTTPHRRGQGCPGAAWFARTCPPGTPVAFAGSGQPERSCETELAVPLGPLDPATMTARSRVCASTQTVNTPLADAIDHVAEDLAGVTGRRIVVVVSDGQENCGGRPRGRGRRLRDQGFDVTVNVVGLGLDAGPQADPTLAGLGRGSYFDARTVGQLDEAIGAAVSAPFDVYDSSGAIVASGSSMGPRSSYRPGPIGWWSARIRSGSVDGRGAARVRHRRSACQSDVPSTRSRSAGPPFRRSGRRATRRRLCFRCHPRRRR